MKGNPPETSQFNLYRRHLENLKHLVNVQPPTKNKNRENGLGDGLASSQSLGI
jgi:hypothetical protein